MSTQVNITLAGRQFRFVCEAHEKEGLLDAATFLDQHMEKMRSASRSPGFDRLAVLAAMDITRQLLDERQQSENNEQIATTLQRLRQRMEQALEQVPESL